MNILPKPIRVAFRNHNTLRDKLVRSKLRPDYEEEQGVFNCGRKNCDMCNILEPGNESKSTNSGVVNSGCVLYLLTCRKQYVE